MQENQNRIFRKGTEAWIGHWQVTRIIGSMMSTIPSDEDLKKFKSNTDEVEEEAIIIDLAFLLPVNIVEVMEVNANT